MSEILNFFADNPEVAGSIAKTVPSIMGMHQANKAKNAIEGPDGYQEKLENLERNRQELVNPYATISNPYANLQVATKAAEMQAEQSDIALANTLDILRQTGAGGATALAQAALKSKQGISANIQNQEAQNQRLQAQGQAQVDMAKARGAAGIMGMQERREEAQLDRLQGQIDLAQQQRAVGSAVAASAGASALGGLASLMKPIAADLRGNPVIETDLPVDPGITSGTETVPGAGNVVNVDTNQSLFSDDLSGLFGSQITGMPGSGGGE